MYKLTSNQGPSQDYPILKISTGEYIFPAADCRQYVEYLAWLDEGNTPLPAPEPEPISVLTTEQKLEAVGLTVTELRKLFGLAEGNEPLPADPE
jgi:hypothetical protein